MMIGSGSSLLSKGFFVKKPLQSNKAKIKEI